MDLSFERNIKFFARAGANIALVKYWGKKNETLKLPHNSSLSMTLNSLYTDTGMAFHTGEQDIFYLNGVLQNPQETEKISTFVDFFRTLSRNPSKVFISSYNSFPTAAGLASSASGYAALAGASDFLFQTNLSKKELSCLTRRGSGSACRSLFGGFVEWQAGASDDTSYAQPFASAEDYAMLILVLNPERKKHSSTQAMKEVVRQSIFYPAWVEQAERDIMEMKQAILEKDFSRIGQIAEANCLKMHATTLGINNPFTYWIPESLMAMEQVRELRNNGLEVYFTMDAGPNVKIFCRKKDLPSLITEMKKYYSMEQLIPTESGAGYTVKECENFGQSESSR